MLKKELIWREILHKTFSEGVLVFTQKELAAKLKVSLSTVNNALATPRKAGAIEVTGRNFRVTDKEKFLLLWASHRHLGKEVIYQTRLDLPVAEIEGQAPPGIIFGAYSAYVRQYQDRPADYDTVYLYADTKLLSEIKKRFPPTKGFANLIVLKADTDLKKYGEITPAIQTFVDLWNLPHWYAKDFLNEQKKKLRI